MQRIGTTDSLFHDGDPATGAVGTRVTAAILNALQEELAAPIEAMGLTLDSGDNGQLLKVLQRFFAWWMVEAEAVAYDTASTFTVGGDRTAIYTAKRAVKLTQTADAQGYVVGASYSAGPDETTVTVDCTVDSGLSAVYYGQEPGNQPNGDVPVGALAAFAVSSPPDGWLECDGSALAMASYPELYAHLQNGGAACIYGESGTDFYLPDFRGKFLRGWDHGAGNDPDAATRTDRGDGTGGDNVGSKQADALQGHWHDVQHGASTGGSDYVANYADSNNLNVTDNGGSATLDMAYSATTVREDLANSHGTPRISDETRPANTNVMWCIKY